jgi:cell division protein FtsA
MHKQAEELKVKFGSALASETNSNDFITVKGLRDRPAKEISVFNLANIIESRMEEIIGLVHGEIIQSGYDDKLAGGIIITGGGSQLAHLKQMFEYMTGIPTRVGYPNEHLGRSISDNVKSPMYATAIGLVLAGFMSVDERENKYKEIESVNGKAQAATPEVKNIQSETKQMNPNKSSLFGFGINKINEKIKSFLIDDIDDKTDY